GRRGGCRHRAWWAGQPRRRGRAGGGEAGRGGGHRPQRRRRAPAGRGAGARGVGRPAVVGAPDLSVDVASVRAGGQTVPEGTLIAINGTGGEVVLGRPRIAPAAAGPHLDRLLEWADEVSGGSSGRSEAERLDAARAVLLPG